MGRLTEIEAFVSSPGDCARERAALQDAVDEYNRVSVPTLRVMVRAFGPADLHAAHGRYAQEGVNRQLHKHELHVGLWRESPGTPTPNAPSGTVEELRLALDRHDRTRRPWIMCYFWKASPTDFSAIKEVLKAHGWYYHDFDDAPHLGRLFLTHLSGYVRDEHRLPGHSTTRLEPHGQRGQAPDLVLTFELLSPGGAKRKLTFHRRVVAVGRQPERCDIVLPSERVHREQGSFVWKDGVVFYVDAAGDAHYRPDPTADAGVVAYGLQTIRIGDAMVMPDGTQIVLRAIVD